MRSDLPVFMLKEISSTTSEVVAYHHAGDKSLPPCEANGNKTRAIGPLTGIERILYQKSQTFAFCRHEGETYTPPIATQRDPMVAMCQRWKLMA